MGSPPVLARIRLFLAALLGSRYAAVVATVDRAAVVFAAGFATKAVASGLLSIDHITDLSYWQTAATSGVLAVLVLVQGLITQWVTGSPALTSFVSGTLRHQGQTGYAVQHRPPLLAPRGARDPRRKAKGRR
jgi:hypothetical protein